MCCFSKAKYPADKDRAGQILDKVSHCNSQKFEDFREALRTSGNDNVDDFISGKYICFFIIQPGLMIDFKN